MAENDELRISGWVQTYIDRLSATEQRKLLKRLAQEMRRRNQDRMRAQISPEGEPWKARKAQRTRRNKKGQIISTVRRLAMMRKLRQTAHFKIRARAEASTVGWSGRDAMIASKQHYGGEQRLQFGLAKYPARPLIGINDADIKAAQSLILTALEEGK